MRIYLNRYCVYHHIYNGRIFYVGMGVPNRPYQITNRSKLWRAFVELIGGEFDVEIVGWRINRKHALIFESKQIRKTKAPLNIENRPGQYGLTAEILLEKLLV